MSIHGALVPTPDDADDYRSRFVTNDEGRIKPKLANNFFWMLKGHPEMRGVWMRGFDSATNLDIVWIEAQPPWGEIAGWKPRAASKSDFVQARMWLERQGLRPSLKETIDAIDLIAHNNC